MPTMAKLPPPVPWGLERTPTAQLAPAYADVAAFVARLEAQGIEPGPPAGTVTGGWSPSSPPGSLARRSVRPRRRRPRRRRVVGGRGARLQRDREPLAAHQGRHPHPTPPGTTRSPSPSSAPGSRPPSAPAPRPTSPRDPRRPLGRRGSAAGGAGASAVSQFWADSCWRATRPRRTFSRISSAVAVQRNE